MILLKVKRFAKKPTYTIGRFSVDEKYLCESLEDKDRDLNNDGDLNEPGEEKIKGQTAIPKGTYNIQWKHSQTFNKIMPYLMNVPGFKNVMIHPGNDSLDTKGCILIGYNNEPGKVLMSKIAFNKLMNLIYLKQCKIIVE